MKNSMTLENLVCSLESAKRLKELGVPQGSFFYWHDGTTIIYPDYQPNMNRSISAFTAGELGEMLPCFIYKNGSGYLACTKHPNSYKISYGIGEEWIQKEAETEAEARAKALIYLLENSIIQI